MSSLRLAIIALALTLLLSGEGRAGTLRVVTLDGSTRRPIPARVSIRGADGKWVWGLDARGAPLEYGGLPRHWSEGSIEVEVPAGRAEVIASRPFAWLPASTTVEVPAEGEIAAELVLDLLVDLPAMGWIGGDAHTHVVHGERHFAVDLPLAARIARAEGLDWAAFGEVWTSVDETQPGPEDLQRLCARLTDDLFLAAWTREHPKDHLGHMAAFPLGGAVDFAETVGANRYEGSLERREDFSHFEILRGLRVRNGLAVYTHPTREYGGTPESPANIARELPFDAVAAPWALEALDVLTDAPDNASNLKLWRFLLDRGHRLAACGFSDACYDRRGERPGDTRTYVRAARGSRSMEGIVDAVRRGWTFATTGPLVLLEVEDADRDQRVFAVGGNRKVRVRAWNAVDYRDPREPALLTRVEVLQNGVVWKHHRIEGGRREAEISLEVVGTERAWYVVQVHGSHPGQFAVTSPIYFEAPDTRPIAAARAEVRGTVTGPGGRPLAGVVRAVEHGKGHRRVAAEEPFRDGKYRIRCPADCRIEVAVEGLAPAMKSIFLDCDAIYRDLFWPIRREKLWDPEFYREIEKRLGDVVLDFQLDAKPETGGHHGAR